MIKENELTAEMKSYEGESGDLRATISGNIISIVTRNGVPLKKSGAAASLMTRPVCNVFSAFWRTRADA